MNKIVIWVLLGLLIFFILRISLLNNKLEKHSALTATLAEDSEREIILNKNTLIHKYREPAPDALTAADGQTPPNPVIKLQTKYIAPEGGFKIVQKTDGAFSIDVKDKGFTFAPFGGIGAAADGFGFYGGARLLYYKRYGLGLAYGGNSGGGRAVIAADRRLDDITPLLSNSAAGVYIGRGYFGIAFNVYL